MTVKKYASLFLLAAALVIFCAACFPVKTQTTSTKPVTGSAAAPKDALAAAEAAYGRGQYQAAAGFYKSYLAALPNPANLENILATYGLAAERGGLYGESVLAYERLLRDFPGGDFAREAAPHLVYAYLGAGEALKAESFGRELLSGEKDAARQNLLRLYVAQAQWLDKRYPAAFQSYLDLWRTSEGEMKKSAEEGVLASLTALTPTALGDVQKSCGQNFPGPEATYVLVRKALEVGDAAGAKAHAEYFAKYFSESPLALKVSELAALAPGAALPAQAFGQSYDPRPKAAASLPSGGPAVSDLSGLSGSYAIAAVLPVSEPGASKYAQEVANGLSLALKRAPGGDRITLAVLDTRGDGREAARLVEQAASDPRVMVVVGPLLSREAAAAAQAAEAKALPMISISQRMDLTGIGPNIFRLFLTPKHQAEAVARYAVTVEGHRELGVLAPSDAFGRSMKTYFEAEARRQGAAVTVSDSYDPKAANWGEAVTRLTGGGAARRVSVSYQADTGFTALFMPDAAGPVSQILPLMAFHDVTRMRYLGSPLWLNPDLLKGGSARYIQGAVIPAALSELSGRSETQSFISAYKAAYGQTPDQFAAYGHDAGLAIINALGSGAKSREEVRLIISQAQGLPGAVAPFGFDAGGDYLAEPTLLTVKDQEFILLRDAASAVR